MSGGATTRTARTTRTTRTPRAAARLLRTIIFGRISISPVTITKLVVEKPSCNPIRAILGGGGKIPVITRMRVARLGNAFECFIFGLFSDVTPVVWWSPRTVILEMIPSLGQPPVDIVCLFLPHNRRSVSTPELTLILEIVHEPPIVT